MNRILTIFAMALLLLSPVTMAQFQPPPTVIVKLYSNSVNTNVANVEVLLEDTSLVAPSYTYTTNEYGEILVNVDTLWSKWDFGHTIKATIVDCASKPECSQAQVMRDDGQVYGVWFKFDLTTKFCAEQTVTACPESTTTTTTEYVKCDVTKALEYGELFYDDRCNVSIQAPSKPEIWDYSVELVVTVVVTMVASLSAGYGLKFYKSKVTGKVTTTHLHPGIRGYHDIYILHSDKGIRHPRNCFDPVYENKVFVKCKSGLHKF